MGIQENGLNLYRFDQVDATDKGDAERARITQAVEVVRAVYTKGLFNSAYEKVSEENLVAMAVKGAWPSDSTVLITTRDFLANHKLDIDKKGSKPNDFVVTVNPPDKDVRAIKIVRQRSMLQFRDPKLVDPINLTISSFKDRDCKHAAHLLEAVGAVFVNQSDFQLAQATSERHDIALAIIQIGFIGRSNEMPGIDFSGLVVAS